MKVAYATAAKMFFRGESHILPAEGACGYDRIDLQEQFLTKVLAEKYAVCIIDCMISYLNKKFAF